MDVKEQISALKDDDGRIRVDRWETADILNNYFEFVFKKESEGQMPIF